VTPSRAVRAPTAAIPAQAPLSAAGGPVYVIDGRPVSGKNHTKRVWRGGRQYTVKSDAAAAWQVDAVAQLVKQRGRRPTLRSPVYVEYVAYQSADVCDIDNMESALFDALKKALIIADDALIHDHRGRKAIDRARPRFEVTVTPMPEAP
jgi:Holliday junction resolvase RusA-like endonuclease